MYLFDLLPGDDVLGESQIFAWLRWRTGEKDGSRARSKPGQVHAELWKLNQVVVAIIWLYLVDTSAAISIESIKGSSPVTQVLPELAELVDIDGSGVILVKHSNHQRDGLDIKSRQVVVSQRLSEKWWTIKDLCTYHLELFSVEHTSAVRVNFVEPFGNLRIVSHSKVSKV